MAELLGSYQSVLVGFSGGVDSALVAVAARRVLGRGRVVAALGVSPSLGSIQRERAVELAARFDVPWIEVATAEMDDPAYVRNAPDRCYFCKRELWDKLGAEARRRGLAVVVDGTNADDVRGHRPGVRAASERAVRSPLALAGYRKAEVRREARALGIPIWNAPAAPCLSSRLMYGLSVTPARLRQVERAEARLRGLGIDGDLRVRHRGAEARIEVPRDAFGRVRAARATIATDLLALGFDRVTLDLRGYRTGSLLESDRGAAEIEVLGERGGRRSVPVPAPA